MKTVVVVVMIIMASVAVPAIVVMAWTGLYFSTHPTTYQGVKGKNVTNVATDYVTVGIGPYDVELEDYDLDGDEVTRKRKEKVKEVNRLVSVRVLVV